MSDVDVAATGVQYASVDDSRLVANGVRGSNIVNGVHIPSPQY